MGSGPPPSSGAARRAEFADFLKARRAAIQPQDVALQPGARRRTPGLRREEVATLAGVGLSWYTWLEQGRDVTPSTQVLDALSRALLLTPDHREHLFALAGVGIPVASADPSGQVDPKLVATIEGLSPHPAFLLDDRFDVVTYNRPCELVLHGLVTSPQPNLLVWLFNDRDAWTDGLEATWTATAHANLLDFRAAYAAHAGEPEFDDLVRQLSETSVWFRTWWTEHDVAALEPARRTMRHPELGPLELDLLQARVGPEPSLRMRVLVPADDTTRRILAARAADLRETTRAAAGRGASGG